MVRLYTVLINNKIIVARHVYIIERDVKCTFEEAMNSKESKNWQKAMNKEIECLNKSKTWTLVDRVQNKKIIEVK